MISIHGQVQPKGDSKLDAPRSIHLEQPYSRASGLGQSNQLVICLTEVPVPMISTGVKEANYILRVRINRGEVGALVAIASIARQGEIFRIVVAAMLNGKDVFDVKKNVRNRVLRHATILAPVSGALAHHCTDKRGHGCARLVRVSRALAFRIPRRSIASTSSPYSLCSISVSAPSAARPANRSMCCRVSASSWKRRICSADSRVSASAHGARTRSSMLVTSADINDSLPPDSDWRKPL